MSVKLISITPDAEKTMAYCARVSNPSNQDNPDYAKLLKYCIKNKHWSIFEQATMTVEVTTSLAIATQILRHKFCFQQFSQRYSQATEFNTYPARRQDTKNRQNSIDDLSEETKIWFIDAQQKVIDLSSSLYKEALSKGIAKEQARFLLPQLTQTRMYMTGNVRSFIHYIELRTDPSTQLEHRQVAEEIKKIFIEQLPAVSLALGWTNE